MKKKAVLMTVIAALCVGLDQMTKYLLMGKDRVLIPHILNLTTAFNKGAAMSLFSGSGVWLLILTGIMILAGIFMVLKHAKSLYALILGSCIIGGAAGNWIDRCIHGYVIDLFEFTFIDFYIFNVADVFITVGMVLCAVSILFFSEKDWGMKNT